MLLYADVFLFAFHSIYAKLRCATSNSVPLVMYDIMQSSPPHIGSNVNHLLLVIQIDGCNVDQRNPVRQNGFSVDGRAVYV